VGTAGVVNPVEPERPPSVSDPIGRVDMADLNGVIRARPAEGVGGPDVPRLSEIFWRWESVAGKACTLSSCPTLIRLIVWCVLRCVGLRPCLPGSVAGSLGCVMSVVRVFG
jgi:hypothetical protein